MEGNSPAYLHPGYDFTFPAQRAAAGSVQEDVFLLNYFMLHWVSLKDFDVTE